MKKLNSLFIHLIIFGLLLTSCIKPVDLELPEIRQQVVLLGILSTDKTISVNLAYTKAVEDTSEQTLWIDNAKILLSENGQEKESLIYTEGGIYTSPLIPEEAKTYEIKVEIPGEKTLLAKTTIPTKTRLDSAIYRFSSRNNLEGIPLKDYVGYFTDPKEERNYYEMYFSLLRAGGMNDPRFYPDIVNSSIIEPAILAEGNPENSYGFSGFSFTDATFEGETYGLELSFTTSDDPIGYIPDPQRRPFLELHHIDAHLYLYRKSLKRHLANQASGIVFAPGDFDLVSLLLLGEPVELYSNIENGLGIFASYNESERACRFIR